MFNTRRRRRGERIEPRFETARTGGGELRADPSERAGGTPRRKASGRNRRARARRPRKRSFLRRTLYWGTVAAVWIALLAGGIVAYYGAGLPPISDLKVPQRAPTVTMVAANGQVLATRGIGHGRDVRLNELPAYLPQAIIAIEDRRFRWHFGIDPIGLARAALRNAIAGRVVQGGSTLTQQLAKNLFLEPERTVSRKVQEMILALWLEREFTKDEILELYLNRVYFGAGTYGVEAAAQRFFGKPARAVTLAEAAVLAGLLKAPSRYAPTRNPDLAEDRAQTVITAMADTGFISPAEALAAIGHPARLVAPDAAGAIDYVADWISDALPGYVGQPDRDIIVETTIDPRLQRAAERALADVLDEEGAQVEASQGALVAIDRTGAVRAMVGGRSYAESQFNRATRALRQPGSSFKTFVYLAALESGLTPDTVREDRPVRFGTWSPSNYDNRHRGPVTLREGLADSINTLAAQLASEAGVDRVIATARRLGITAPIERNLSIALGTSEVTLVELTGAYVPFANGGYGVLPHLVRRVKTADGKLLYERTGSGPGRIVSSRHVGAMNDMLKEALHTGTARRAAFGDWPAAGKTGTTQDWRDAWFVGYTAHLTAGVWIGNDDGTSMKRVSGGSLPAMAWHRFMAEAHEGVRPMPLPGDYWRNPDHAPAVAGIGEERVDAPINLQPPRPREDGGLRINTDFLKRIFGG